MAITRHLIRVLDVLAQSGNRWVTNAELCQRLSDIAPRTIRTHTQRLTQAGCLDRVEVFPEYGFRLADPMAPEAAALVERIRTASQMLA